MYEAIGVRDIDQILNTQNVDKPKDPASENSQALDGSPLKAFSGQQHDAHIMTHLLFGMSPIVGGNQQVAINLQKHVFDHIRLKAEETVEAELFQQYGTDPEGLVSALQREAMVALKVAQFFQEVKQMQSQMMGDQTDPLVKLKEQEIQQSAQRDQARMAMDQQRLAFDQQKENNDMAIEQAKLAQKGASDVQKTQQVIAQSAQRRSQAR
jgi:hypothetical protein